MLSNKRILIGITGGIAAYKIPALIRLIQRENGEVKCVLTDAAKQFVTETTLSAISRNPVYSDLFSQRSDIDHISLSRWADCFLVAPASANTLGKMAHGLADNLLTACYLSFKGPVLATPAMNTAMWEHPAVRDNMKILKKCGVGSIEPETGELACGEEGAGRMADPEIILQHIIRAVSPPILKNKNVLITAGPTREYMDPVRFISNISSGKMGAALGAAAYHFGGRVTVITGPGSVSPFAGCRVIPVNSAAEMFRAVKKEFPKCDVFISNAAVADFSPTRPTTQKQKKEEIGKTIPVSRTTDILAWTGKNKKKQKIIGFALETINEEAGGIQKLKKKKCDYIAVNSTRKGGAGGDKNAIVLLDKKSARMDFPLQPKNQLARQVLEHIFKK